MAPSSQRQPQALEIDETDKELFASRSRCHLLAGDADKALLDALQALELDATYYKGVFQRAEALFAKAEFEQALVQYHRGHRLRPDLEEFRLGIQKCHSAIQHSLGRCARASDILLRESG